MKRLLLLSLFSVPLASCTFILGFQKSLQCGDEILTEAKGEECDDGNTDPANGQTDNCSADCKIPVCGDGIVDPFGTVDRNGDGIINFNDGNEQCDDGNNVDADGCEADCVSPVCGDGIVETVPTIDTDADGIADATEACDDGTTCADGAACDPNIFPACADNSNCQVRGGDGCSQDCTNVEECGDAFLDQGEQCDDGNNIDGDGCSALCKKPGCGDNILDPGELCLSLIPSSVFSGQVRDLKVGDLNGDGDVDLVVSQISLIKILFGNGDGTFAAAIEVTTESNTSSAIAIGDFDNNGTLDIMVQDRAAPAVLDVIQVNANQTVANTVDATDASLQGPFLTGDFNGDGDLDIFNTGINADQLEAGAGNRLFTSTAPTFSPVAVNTFANAVAGDLNVDGATDLVFTNNAAGVGLVIAISGIGNSFATTAIPEVASIRDLDLGDVDGDGDLDLFYITGNELKVLLNDSAGVFAAPLTAADNGSDELFAVDFSSDGVSEMFLLDGGEATVFGLIDGAIAVTTQLNGMPFNPNFINFADLDNDGLQDFIFSSNGLNVSFLLGTK